MDMMSRCGFSATAKRTAPIEHAYEDRLSKRKETVRITGTQEYGIATIYDQDVLMFVISQLVDAKSAGMPMSRRVRFTPYQFFRVDEPDTDGKRLSAVARLAAPAADNDHRNDDPLGIHAARPHPAILVEFGTVEDAGKLSGVEIVIAEWLFESVEEFNVLTLDKLYFRIAGPVERWLYQHARKATGGETGKWQESFKSLYDKSASQQDFKHYASTLRKLAKLHDLPGFRLTICTGTNGKPALLMERTEKRQPLESANQAQMLLIEQTPLEEAWDNALAILCQKLGTATVHQWLKPLQPVIFEAGTLTYRAPTKFISGWVESLYLSRLREAWKAVGYDVGKVAFATRREKAAA